MPPVNIIHSAFRAKDLKIFDTFVFDTCMAPYRIGKICLKCAKCIFCVVIIDLKEIIVGISSLNETITVYLNDEYRN